MKYKIPYYITVIILCVMMLQSVVYAEKTVFQVENQKGKKGENVTVPIEIQDVYKRQVRTTIYRTIIR